MSWLSVQELGKRFGGRVLFKEFSLSFEAGERVGLIGPNGAGKSTLLKILAGLEVPDTGQRIVQRQLRLRFLPQEPQFPAGLSVQEILFNAAKSATSDEDEAYRLCGHWLSKMKFANPQLTCDELPGGWRKRLALACELLHDPNLLLMDEPTNHLDLEGIWWLEQFILSSSLSVVVISHDRAFLENIATRIVEINAVYPQGYLSSPGAYSDFILFRDTLIQSQLAQQQSLANKVRREVEWLRQGVKARTTKSSARIQEAHRLQSELKELSGRNEKAKISDIQFSHTSRKSEQWIRLSGVGKSYQGQWIVRGFDFTLCKGMRLALVGANGSGKTTLMKLLSGQINADEGQVEWLSQPTILNFEQNREQLDKRQKLGQALCPQGDHVIYQGRSIHVIAWAKRFLFRTDQLDLSLGDLSGGEQARVLIAKFMLREADILLMDEPTNDLDLATLELLEERLLEFPGAIVVSSHDRLFLRSLATHVLGLHSDQGRFTFCADIDQWEVIRQQELQEMAAAPSEKSVAKLGNTTSKITAKLSYEEKKELNQIEKKIQTAEEVVQRISRQMEDGNVSSNAAKLLSLQAELDQAQAKVDRIYARWQELEAKNG